MAGAFDISGINYGYNGPAMSVPGSAPMNILPPAAMAGASNPVGAAIQNQAVNGSNLTGFGGTPAFSPNGAAFGMGLNLPTMNLALGGLQTLGGLWNAFEQRRMAQRQFDFVKDTTNTNMKNQIQAYNTTLEDRSRSRAHTEGQSPEQAQAYIDKNRLSR